MRIHSYIFTLLILVLVSLAMGSMAVGAKNEPASSTETPSESPIIVTPEAAITPPAIENVATTTERGMITVSAPLPNTKVTSPLLVTGSARGNWYFEASFPIRLIDAKGNTILQTHAEAQEDWMTENFVPFTSTLEWSSASTTATSGVLVLMRDNPSGLPEHDAEIRIPVTF